MAADVQEQLHVAPQSSMPTHEELQRRIAFYDQILRLRDEVIAERHPRIKLSKAALYELQNTRRLGQNQQDTQPSQPCRDADPRDRPRGANADDDRRRPSRPHTQDAQQSRGPIQQSAVPPSSIPAFDPIFLQTPDVVNKAQLDLKRKRIEKLLKDSAESKAAHLRKTVTKFDGVLDASEILDKAQQIEPHHSGLASKRPSLSSDFDENSYYSSQAYSWSSGHPEEDNARVGKSPIAANDTGHVTTQLGQRRRQFEPTRPATPQGRRFSLEETTQQDPSRSFPYDGTDREASEHYSPPAAEPVSLDRSTLITTGVNRGEGVLGHHAAARGYERAVSPTADPIHVIQNQIRSPLAPQPSRISPYALAKDPLHQYSPADVPFRSAPQDAGAPSASGELQQQNLQSTHRGNHRSPNLSKGVSPRTGRVQGHNARKRRWEGDTGDRFRRPSGKRVARSPRPRSPVRSPRPARSQVASPLPLQGPLIKDEPMSPQPFASMPEIRAVRQRPIDRGRGDMEVISPRSLRPHSIYPADRYDTGFSRVDARSSATPRVYVRPERDDPDLRRVASYHQASAIRGDFNYGRPRAVSQFVERAPIESRAYFESTARPVEVRYARGGAGRSPVPAFDPYQPRLQTPGLMGPPPLRREVVVDGRGERYYTVAREQDRRAPALPLTYVRDGDAYLDHAHSRTRPIDPYGEMEEHRHGTSSRSTLVHYREPSPHLPSRSSVVNPRAQSSLPQEYLPAAEQTYIHPAEARDSRHRSVALYDEQQLPLPTRQPLELRAYSTFPEPSSVAPPSSSSSTRRMEALPPLPVEYVARHGSMAPPPDNRGYYPHHGGGGGGGTSRHPSVLVAESPSQPRRYADSGGGREQYVVVDRERDRDRDYEGREPAYAPPPSGRRIPQHEESQGGHFDDSGMGLPLPPPDMGHADEYVGGGGRYSRMEYR